MSKITELRGQLDDRRSTLAKAFEEAGDDFDMDKVKSLDGADSAAKAAQIKALNDEMSDLGRQIDEIEGFKSIKDGVDELGEVEDHPGHSTKGKAERKAQQKSIGEMFTESIAFTGWKSGMKEGPVASVPVDLKTTFQTDTGWTVFNPRGPKVVDYATRPVMVADILPHGSTNGSAIVYMEETTFTNAAVEVSEGSAKPEAALKLTERTEPVRKIAVWIPVTDEQLADVPQVESYLNNRLGFMVRQRLDSQILVGDGTAPNLAGIEDDSRTGLQTQAKGSDSTPDAVYKAMTKTRVGAFSEPNAAVFHPNDWQQIRLLTTADGIYIWGPPYAAGEERIWGLRVVQATAQTENIALVGDFNQAELVMRSGLDFAVSNSHDTYFIKNMLAIRAELRAALAVYRPAAFCTVTGI